MSFKNTNLASLVYANGFTLWQFRDDDATIADLKAKDFFNSASNMVRKGDVIIATGSDNTTLFVVDSTANGTVHIAPVV